MTVTMDAASWMQIIGLGALMGATGQGARTIVGVKKLNDAASSSAASLADLFDASRMIISLAIGAIAGVLAAVTTIADITHVGAEQLVALAGAGYVGADFIEGFMTRAAPAPGAAAGEAAVGTGGTNAAIAADGAVG